MKQVNVGIMPLKDFQAYTKAIVTGKHKRKRGEPKIWFSSMASLAHFQTNTNSRRCPHPAIQNGLNKM